MKKPFSLRARLKQTAVWLLPLLSPAFSPAPAFAEQTTSMAPDNSRMDATGHRATIIKAGEHKGEYVVKCQGGEAWFTPDGALKEMALTTLGAATAGVESAHLKVQRNEEHNRLEQSIEITELANQKQTFAEQKARFEGVQKAFVELSNAARCDLAEELSRNNIKLKLKKASGAPITSVTLKGPDHTDIAYTGRDTAAQTQAFAVTEAAKVSDSSAVAKIADPLPPAAAVVTADAQHQEPAATPAQPEEKAAVRANEGTTTVIAKTDEKTVAPQVGVRTVVVRGNKFKVSTLDNGKIRVVGPVGVVEFDVVGGNKIRTRQVNINNRAALTQKDQSASMLVSVKEKTGVSTMAITVVGQAETSEQGKKKKIDWAKGVISSSGKDARDAAKLCGYEVLITKAQEKDVSVRFVSAENAPADARVGEAEEQAKNTVVPQEPKSTVVPDRPAEEAANEPPAVVPQKTQASSAVASDTSKVPPRQAEEWVDYAVEGGKGVVGDKGQRVVLNSRAFPDGFMAPDAVVVWEKGVASVNNADGTRGIVEEGDPGHQVIAAAVANAQGGAIKHLTLKKMTPEEAKAYVDNYKPAAEAAPPRKGDKKAEEAVANSGKTKQHAAPSGAGVKQDKQVDPKLVAQILDAQKTLRQRVSNDSLARVFQDQHIKYQDKQIKDLTEQNKYLLWGVVGLSAALIGVTLAPLLRKRFGGGFDNNKPPFGRKWKERFAQFWERITTKNSRDTYARDNGFHRWGIDEPEDIASSKVEAAQPQSPAVVESSMAQENTPKQKREHLLTDFREAKKLVTDYRKLSKEEQASAQEAAQSDFSNYLSNISQELSQAFEKDPKAAFRAARNLLNGSKTLGLEDSHGLFDTIVKNIPAMEAKDAEQAAKYVQRNATRAATGEAGEKLRQQARDHLAKRPNCPIFQFPVSELDVA